MLKSSSNRLIRINVILFALIFLISSLFIINLSEATLQTSMNAAVVGAVITGPELVGLNKSVTMSAARSPSYGTLSTWQVTPGTGEATINSTTGLLTGTRAGSVKVTVKCTAGGKTGTSKPFTAWVIDGLKVIPDPKVLCLGDPPVHFIAYSVDVQGNVVQVADATLTWSCSGTIGNIDSYGTFRSTNAGIGTVTATRTSDGATNSAAVTVVGIDSVNPTQKIIPIGYSVTFTAVTNPTGYGDMVSWSVSPEGDSGKGGTFTVTFTNVGIHTVTARCGTSSKTATITVVKVESIGGLGSLYCTHPDCSVTVTAVLTYGVALPAEYSIVWGGNATFLNQSGRTATAKFAGHAGKNLRITAALGAQIPASSSAFTVVEHTSVIGVTAVTYNFTAEDPGGDYGITSPEYPAADITAFFNHPSHNWHCKVTSSTCEIGQGWHLVTGVSEATVEAATTETIYRKMVADLQAYGEGSGIQWYCLGAVQAHETVHSNDWQGIVNPLFGTFKATVETLTVSYVNGTCETPAQAKAAIKALTQYVTAYDDYLNDCATEWNTNPVYSHPGCDSRTYAAESSVTTPLISALDAKAAAQTPPWTR